MPSLTERFICIAKFGTIAIGRFVSTNTESTSKALAPFNTTVPAAPRGRSSHVFSMRPPYISTFSLVYPFTEVIGLGLTRIAGKSVCAEAIRNVCSGFFPI